MSTTQPKPLATLSERISRLDPKVLTPRGKALLLVLAGCADRYTGRNVWLSIESLVAESGIARTQVYAVLGHLRKIGALVIDPNPGPRPRGVDRVVKPRMIVIDHLPATDRKAIRAATLARQGKSQSRDYETSRKKDDESSLPRDYEPSLPKNTTVPLSMSPSETSQDRPHTPTQESPRVGGCPLKDFNSRLTDTLNRLGVASGPRANPRWIAAIRTNRQVRTNDDALAAVEWAIRRARENMGQQHPDGRQTVNYASDVRLFIGGWKPRAVVMA